VKPGNAMPLERMPVGTIVHNIELKPRKGGQVARSAGAYAQYVGRDSGWAILRLNSGEQRRVHGSCLATVGAVSNQDHANTSLGKAGRNRWLGRKPVNRGVTMNPVKAAPLVAATRFRRGASPPRASVRAATRLRTSSSFAAVT
jgi:large subunit ribosomal protein L2